MVLEVDGGSAAAERHISPGGLLQIMRRLRLSSHSGIPFLGWAPIPSYFEDYQLS